jgi:hypothetical protein
MKLPLLPIVRFAVSVFTHLSTEIFITSVNISKEIRNGNWGWGMGHGELELRTYLQKAPLFQGGLGGFQNFQDDL